MVGHYPFETTEGDCLMALTHFSQCCCTHRNNASCWERRRSRLLARLLTRGFPPGRWEHLRFQHEFHQPPQKGNFLSLNFSGLAS